MISRKTVRNSLLLLVLFPVLGFAHNAHLTWTASTTPSVTYEVFRVQCTTPQATVQKVVQNGVCSGVQTTLAMGIAGTVYDDPTIQPGTSYEYFLDSVDSMNNHSVGSSTVLITVAPAPPTGVVIGSHN
jgi:hypothetical protein